VRFDCVEVKGFFGVGFLAYSGFYRDSFLG
jgi:hypothetical protein